MRYSSFDAFMQLPKGVLDPKGPYALVFLEDAAEVEGTITHLLETGFSDVLVFGAEDLLNGDADRVHLITHALQNAGDIADVVNIAIGAFPGMWLHYCYNSEFLFFPFCETRKIRELTTFITEERRDTVMTYVIDLYTNDLGNHPNAVSRDAAHFDRSGYYALQRFDEDGAALDRQLDFYGGLRWRYEEHVPWPRRRIDRVGLFRAQKGLRLNADHTFNVPEYNTYSCPWHHNLSATICSFRTAKALMNNPGSMHAIPHFWWKNSEKFEWSSNQLMQLGLMEPGQWF